jgi:hypothetical protein
MLSCLILVTGCSTNTDAVATISVQEDSDYETTFQELHLGEIFDFHFNLKETEDQWVTLWVDEYVDGEKENNPAAEMAFGGVPQDGKEGNLGMGIINAYSEAPLFFLYGPGVSSRPGEVITERNEELMETWEYALGQEEVALEEDGELLLAAYRANTGNSSRTVDFTDKADVERMIQEEDRVYLFKIKVGPENNITED